MQLEELSQLKNPVILLGIKPATFRLGIKLVKGWFRTAGLSLLSVLRTAGSA
jgi:hypothetical protein